jgi:hypothetical protein
VKRSKAVPGHRCRGAVLSVRVNCECGWSSANWSGTGARHNAYAEFRWHVQECGTPRRSE